jgi:hypothetical protein
MKGVIIEIGCGNKKVCKSCYKSNEIYITPGLEIKPCHASDKVFPLRDLIRDKKDEEILKTFVDSRDYLKERPGEGKNIWST